jgi:hypothetical protein
VYYSICDGKKENLYIRYLAYPLITGTCSIKKIMLTINFDTITNNYEVIYVIKTVMKFHLKKIDTSFHQPLPSMVQRLFKLTDISLDRQASSASQIRLSRDHQLS